MSVCVEKKNGNERRVGIVYSNNVEDMTCAYSYMRDRFRSEPDECPTIITIEELPENVNYMKHGKMILVRRGASILEAIEAEDNYQWDINLPGFNSDAYDVYSFAVMACHALNIKCPQVVPCEKKSMMGCRGMSLQDPNTNITKIILLLQDMPYLDTLEVLFHELRHAWQHEKHHEKYFKDYRFLDSGICIKDYFMQNAELDAEAFSVYMMVRTGIEKYPVKRKKYDEVNREIERRAKRMCVPNPTRMVSPIGG